MGFAANLTTCLAAALLCLCPGIANAAESTIYVDGDAPGDNDGSSWTNAYLYLQDALADASPGDQIHVAEGAYRPDESIAHPESTGDPAAVFLLKNGVIMRGGYAGFGRPDPNARDVRTYQTILSGDLHRNDGPGFVNNDENSYHVILSSGADETTILDGFTITAGNANGPDPNSDGAGMYNILSSPTVINCTFIGNSASWYGGAMFNFTLSNPMIINCAFVDNRAGFVGGAIENRFLSGSTMVNCIFSGNTAEHGGAMGNSAADATLMNCLFVGNAAQSRGGAMYNRFGCEIQLTNTILRDNVADDGPQIAMYIDTELDVSYCNIQGGRADMYVVESTVNFGEGNIDADPCFLMSGHWDVNGIWAQGNYHLLAGSPCIDTADDAALPEDLYDLDGDANTAEPIPVDIDGRERIVDGDNDGNLAVDMGAYEYFIAPIEVPMRFTPRALNLASKGKWVKAHIVLPEGFTIEDVDTNTPAVLEPLGIDSAYINAFVNEDSLIEIEIAFDRAALCRCGSLTGRITVEGVLNTGQGFYGTDTIRIIDKSWDLIVSLASYWLRADCRRPHWCQGLDLNRDSTVNFADLAALPTFSIQFTTH
jgi:hypothetical protein